mgnify:CR=1 FL=1
MNLFTRTCLSLVVFLGLGSSPTLADAYDDAINVFRNAGESGAFFEKSYGYAVFPTIGKGGIGIGGAHGSGKVYRVKSWRGHHLEIKSSRRKRRYAGKAIVDGSSKKAVKRMLPYL